MRDTKQLCLNIIQGLQQSAEPVPGVDGKFHGLYIIVNQVNMKFYVGKHTRKFERLDSYFGSGTALNDALELEGVENFTMTYFEYWSSAEEVHDKETELLKMLLNEVFQGSWELLEEYCYNRKLNGGYNADSDETRAKKSESQWLLGKGYLRTGELNPMFGTVGHLGANFRGITVGINKQQEIVCFNGEKDINSRPTKTGKFFRQGKISEVINGNRASHAGFNNFFRTKSTDILREYLETATFYDEKSREVIINYLESVSVDA